MKAVENVEIKIYELLGIKQFRNIAFALRNQWLKFYINKIKKKANLEYNDLYDTYKLPEIKSLEDLNKYKKILYNNSTIHLYSLILLFPTLFFGTHILALMLLNVCLIGINSYCIMLQRYNCLRIKKVVSKMQPHYEKQKNIIKEEIKKEDLLLPKHTYKVVNKKEKDTNITFENLIDKANINELTMYRNYLVRLKETNKKLKEEPGKTSISIPVGKRKYLKLEFNKDNT